VRGQEYNAGSCQTEETELETVYIVTIWSGGQSGKRWKTLEKPQVLAQGTGAAFTSVDTGLRVEVIGTISIEEYEQGTEIVDVAGESVRGPAKA